MLIELNFKSGKPAYLQIADQIKYAAASGVLRGGEQLPSIRALAERLRINRNTVAKAYSELEHEGVVEQQQGKGVYLSNGASPYAKPLRESILTEAVDGVIVQAHHFQIGREHLLDLMRKRLDEFEERRDREEK